MQDDYIRARIGQVRYLGELLTDWGMPIVQPVGGHAIFLDAKRVLPAPAAGRLPRPDAGGRALPRLRRTLAWSVASSSAGRDPKTGDHNRPKLELTRLTIPRRVYTQAHMDVVAESVKAVCDARESATRACAWSTSRSTCASSRPGSSRWPWARLWSSARHHSRARQRPEQLRTRTTPRSTCQGFTTRPCSEVPSSRSADTRAPANERGSDPRRQLSGARNPPRPTDR